MAELRVLVVTSCTGKKSVSSPRGLRQWDFADAGRLSAREAELRALMRPACDMYTGDQHLLLMRGVISLRRQFGAANVGVHVVSAGYGVIDDQREIAPYDFTFNEMSPREAKAWAAQLGVPKAVRMAIESWPIVFFLLGSRYLDAIAPPITPTRGQRLVYFAKPSEERRLAAQGVTVVPAGKREASAYGAGLVALKGRMFELLAAAVSHDRSLWERVLTDNASGTIVRALVDEARR